MVLNKKNGQTLAYVLRRMYTSSIPMSEALEKYGKSRHWTKKVNATFKKILLKAARYDIHPGRIYQFLNGNFIHHDSIALFILMLYGQKETVELEQLQNAIKMYAKVDISEGELERAFEKIANEHPKEVRYNIEKRTIAFYP